MFIQYQICGPSGGKERKWSCLWLNWIEFSGVWGTFEPRWDYKLYWVHRFISCLLELLYVTFCFLWYKKLLLCFKGVKMLFTSVVGVDFWFSAAAAVVAKFKVGQLKAEQSTQNAWVTFPLKIHEAAPATPHLSNIKEQWKRCLTDTHTHTHTHTHGHTLISTWKTHICKYVKYVSFIVNTCLYKYTELKLNSPLKSEVVVPGCQLPNHP